MPSTTAATPTTRAAQALAIIDQLWDDADAAGHRQLADALHDAATNIARIVQFETQR